MGGLLSPLPQSRDWELCITGGTCVFQRSHFGDRRASVGAGRMGDDHEQGVNSSMGGEGDCPVALLA